MKTILAVNLTINNMKYIINNNNHLLIINDSGGLIFSINEYAYWFKYEYDHNGYQISHEDFARKEIYQ